MKKEKVENTSNDGQQETARELTKLEGGFIDAMADPETKSQTNAAIKAGYSEKSARRIASRLMTKVDIREAIEIRKAEHLRNASIKTDYILGSAAMNMMATIDDCLDDAGRFDINKARETGAIHFVKSIRRSDNKYGESVAFEMYSAADARRELAEYLGIKQLPRENEQKLEASVSAILAFLQLHPDYDVDKAVAAFARAKSIDFDVLKEKLNEALVSEESKLVN